MINYSHIMVRFGELSTKGKNKKDFIRILADNIRRGLVDYKELSYEIRYDHIYIALNGTDYDPVISVLKDISGIRSVSLVYRLKKDMAKIKADSLEMIKNEEGKTFKILAKRSDKKFELTSEEITRAVASNILKNTSLKVDVHNPDIPLNIEIRDEAAYLL